jgi:hypothetical protein
LDFEQPRELGINADGLDLEFRVVRDQAVALAHQVREASALERCRIERGRERDGDPRLLQADEDVRSS